MTFPAPPPDPGNLPAVPYGQAAADQAQAAADHTQAVADHAATPSVTYTGANYAAKSVSWKGIAAIATMAAVVGFLGGDFTHPGIPGSSPQSAGSRNPFTQPFTSTSIWNQPIGSNAVYVAAGIKPLTIRAMTTDEAITVQDPSAPATVVQQNGGQHSNTCQGSGTLATLPIPSALVVPGANSNNQYAVIQSDGQTIDEGGAFARCTAGGPATANRVTTYGTLFGDGLTGGSGGSRLSTLGGTLRPGEIAPGKTEAPHALRINIDCGQDCTPSSPGFRWPATKKDSYAYSPGGSVHALSMGALLAIPPNFDCSSLGLAGAELCRTLQDYGAYVSNDSARSVVSLSTESGDANTAAQFQSDWGFPLQTSGPTGAGWANDVQTIVKNLSVVDNNGPNNIGGGGTPRQPLAAPLATSCLTAARLTAAMPAFDPDSDGDDDFVDPTGGPTPTPTSTPTATASPTPTATAPPTPTTSPSPCPTPTPPPSPTPTPTTTGTPAPTPTPTPASGTPHVMVVMLENKGYAATLGTCSADPYYCSLASQYASFTDSHGISHPSLPNYLAFTSGSTQGCSSDTCATGITAPDLGAQLSNAGIPWTAYMENMPSACSQATGPSPYARKHNPFVYFTDNFARCHDIAYPGAASLVTTLDGASPPSFVWITPNLINDMHTGTVQQGDAWLKANVAPILASSWFTNFNSTVIVTMDEGPSGNQIPTVVISSVSKGQGAIATAVNHYSVLRAIESRYGLALLGGAATATDMTGSFG